MTIPVCLSVRLKTLRQDIHVTDEISDLSFGNSSPGGYTDCTIALYRPISFTPGEVMQFGRMYVYDGLSGETVWEGILQDPGRSAGPGGEVFEIAAVGGSTHLLDDTRILYYADTDMTHWAKTDPGGTRAGSVEQLSDIDAAGNAAMSLRIPQGTGVDGAIPSRIVAHHRGISVADQKLARIAFTWDCGLTAASLPMALYCGTYGLGPADVAWTATFNVAGGTEGRIVDPTPGTGNWDWGRNWPLLRFHFTGAAGNVSADTWWMQITDLHLRCTLFNKSGVEIEDYLVATNPDYASNDVYAYQIVEDLLGRILTAQIDGANATVTTTTFGIEHLAYPEGVSPAQVLDDLLLFEAGYTYHLWESNPDNDKFRFEWVLWPTTVRYEADVLDGFQSSASGNTLYNRVAVRYHNRGISYVVFRTQTVPALVGAGYDRTGFIDLGDAATRTTAERVGDLFLTEHRYPVNSGRLTITEPILDHLTGRMIQPWAIRSGNLIRVRGVESYTDALNSDGRDGLTVFKVASASYSGSDAAATLELDAYAPSVARAIAKIRKREEIRRR